MLYSLHFCSLYLYFRTTHRDTNTSRGGHPKEPEGRAHTCPTRVSGHGWTW